MRKYLNKPVGELAAELAAGPARLRKGYVDAAESLIRIIEPARQYPLEFAVYRITGYRGPRAGPASQPVAGDDLRRDLQSLMLDVCDSFDLRAGDYSDAVYDANSLARRYSISTKTVQRWRRGGLPARRLVFPDGKRRIAFLEGSARWFAGRQPARTARSSKFSQLSEAEKEDMLVEARRLAPEPGRTLSEVAARIASRTGRAKETVRRLIKDHDATNEDDRIFSETSAPLSDARKAVIYRAFLMGISADKLARRFGRSRSSIYRVVNDMRARKLAAREIDYLHNPEFDSPDADETILGPEGVQRPARTAEAFHGPADAVPPYLKDLYDVPLLDAAGERDLFRRYNYLKHKADVLRKSLDLNRVVTSKLKEIEQLLLQANVTKNRIVRANLRLVVSIAKRHVNGPQTLFELVSDGNVSLMQAVEKFDYSRGFRFSTYASWAIMRNFARSVPRERSRRDRFATGNEELLDVAASLKYYDPNRLNVSELRETIDAVLAHLLPRERAILVQHYGLEGDAPTKTLSQLGDEFGLSKERIRQIEFKAMEKLRKILPPTDAELLG